MDRKISEIRKASDVSVLDNTNQLFVFTYDESSKIHVICFGATGAGKSAGTSEILQSIGAGETRVCFSRSSWQSIHGKPNQHEVNLNFMAIHDY